MSAPSRPSSEVITGKAPLVEYLESGGKPREAWRIGTEHEKFAFRCADLAPLPFSGEGGIEAVLRGLVGFGWTPVHEDGHLVALTGNGAGITLEPGGQVELSGAPLLTMHEVCREVNEHLSQVKTIGADLDIGFLGLGYLPKWRRDEIPVVPKARYDIMRRYMPKRGALGLDMMLRTATVQVNLDFADEADMVRKFRVGLALQPVVTALFANSPFIEGRPSGHLSARSHVWTDTDPDRCGMLPWVFEPGMGFERYVDWMLDVPMYFVFRDGRYIDVAGRSFRDFMAGKLPGLEGEFPTMGDWADHLTTAFPEVRLKKFLEMRGADGGPWRRLCALPALWVGLFYSQDSLDAAWDLVKDWTTGEQAQLRSDVPRHGLRTKFRNGVLGEVALTVLEIANQGLRARARTDAHGRDETIFLETLWDSASSLVTPAERMLADFAGRWQGRIESVYQEYSY